MDTSVFPQKKCHSNYKIETKAMENEIIEGFVFDFLRITILPS